MRRWCWPRRIASAPPTFNVSWRPLLPGAMLPLHVFEDRYRALVEHCLDHEGEFGVVLIERGSEVGGGDAQFQNCDLFAFDFANVHFIRAVDQRFCDVLN